jgi:hypothetical protein
MPIGDQLHEAPKLLETETTNLPTSGSGGASVAITTLATNEFLVSLELGFVDPLNSPMRNVEILLHKRRPNTLGNF